MGNCQWRLPARLHHPTCRTKCHLCLPCGWYPCEWEMHGYMCEGLHSRYHRLPHHYLPGNITSADMGHHHRHLRCCSVPHPASRVDTCHVADNVCASTIWQHLHGELYYIHHHTPYSHLHSHQRRHLSIMGHDGHLPMSLWYQHGGGVGNVETECLVTSNLTVNDGY